MLQAGQVWSDVRGVCHPQFQRLMQYHYLRCQSAIRPRTVHGVHVRRLMCCNALCG